MKINLLKTEREYEIGEKTYTAVLSDEGLQSVIEASKKYENYSAKNKDMSELKEPLFGLLDTLFYEGAGEEIYKNTGCSTIGLGYITLQIQEDYLKVMSDLKNKKYEKYLADL